MNRIVNASQPVDLPAVPQDRLLRLVQWIEGRVELVRQRRALASLDDRQLADIGVSRGEAIGEAGRPFWDGEAGNGWQAGRRGASLDA